MQTDCTEKQSRIEDLENEIEDVMASNNDELYSILKSMQALEMDSETRIANLQERVRQIETDNEKLVSEIDNHTSRLATADCTAAETR